MIVRKNQARWCMPCPLAPYSVSMLNWELRLIFSSVEARVRSHKMTTIIGENSLGYAGKVRRDRSWSWLPLRRAISVKKFRLCRWMAEATRRQPHQDSHVTYRIPKYTALGTEPLPTADYERELLTRRFCRHDGDPTDSVPGKVIRQIVRPWRSSRAPTNKPCIAQEVRYARRCYRHVAQHASARGRR